MTKTGDLIAGVDEQNRDRPSPCPDFDAKGMVDHLVGWLQMFEASSHGRRFEGDASAYRTGDDPAAEYRALAASLVDGWRTHGVDREVPMMGPKPSPAAMVFNMTVMEEITHGWDLAKATGQPVPYTDEEAPRRWPGRADAAPQYRGPNMAFGDIVEVPPTPPPSTVCRVHGRSLGVSSERWSGHIRRLASELNVFHYGASSPEGRHGADRVHQRAEALRQELRSYSRSSSRRRCGPSRGGETGGPACWPRSARWAPTGSASAGPPSSEAGLRLRRAVHLHGRVVAGRRPVPSCR